MVMRQLAVWADESRCRGSAAEMTGGVRSGAKGRREAASSRQAEDKQEARTEGARERVLWPGSSSKVRDGTSVSQREHGSTDGSYFQGSEASP
jgi:hypothetical protein